MVTTIHESMTDVNKARSAPTNPAFTSYQIEFLQNEIAFLQDARKRSGVRPHWIRISSALLEYRPVAFLHLHMMQFYWTVTRFLGLRGSRPSRQRLAKPPAKVGEGERIFIDVTATYRYDVKTGIQRVVREVAKASIENGALPVFLEDGKLYSYWDHPDLPEIVEIEAGDWFLILDAGWIYIDEYRLLLEQVARRGGVIIGFYYDIIPLLYPGFFARQATQVFHDWFNMSLPYFSAVIAISRSTAIDLSCYIPARGLPHKPGLRIGWFHLGADFEAKDEEDPSEQILVLSSRMPFFLSVGTIEPRKNHVTVLAAFERLWDQGLDIRLVIVGKRGWLVEALCDRLLRHPELGHRLFWFEACGDSDLRFLYRHATALIQASLAEGFGLPLVEAAHCGTPVIASDIRVFREIGGSSFAFFDPVDPAGLEQCIRAAVQHPRVTSPIPVLSWAASTAQLFNLIKEETYEFALSDAETSEPANPESVKAFKKLG
jgi:alpha-1,2-rhamnosyltransferase